MRRLFAFALAAALSTPLGASAQDFAVAAHGGSMGLGAGVLYGLTPRLNVHGTFGFIPIEPDLSVDEVDFTVNFPSFLRATLDFYPTGSFYLSGGGLLVTNGGDTDVEGTFTGTQEFGGNTYTAAEVGTLTGVFSLSSFMPYLGIGFGNPIGRTVGFGLELGVGFGSVPSVDLGATGPISSDPTFINDLNEREAEVEDDIPTLLRYYPVASLYLSFGFGG